MITDYRALCVEILQKLNQYEDGQRVDWDAWRNTARAALAQPEPVAPTDEDLEDLAEVMNVSGNPVPAMRRALELWGNSQGILDSSPQPEPVAPTDEELLELMPQQFRDDLATVSRLAAHGTSPDVTPGIFRVSLNTGALDYARAVLAKWGHQ